LPKDYKEMGESLMRGFLQYEVRKKLVNFRGIMEDAQVESDEGRWGMRCLRGIRRGVMGIRGRISMMTGSLGS
jgi:hypothetical protein